MEEGLHGAVTWVIEQGAVGGMPLLGFQFGCAANADAIVPSPQHVFSGRGIRSHIPLVSASWPGRQRQCLEARVTSSRDGWSQGFIDITANARNIVFSGFMTAGGLELSIESGRMTIVQEGRSKKFVPNLEHISFSGKNARDKQQQVMFVTERCVIELRGGELWVVEVAPGIDLERDVLGQADVPLHVAGTVKPMDPRLFLPEPMGLELGASA